MTRFPRGLLVAAVMCSPVLTAEAQTSNRLEEVIVTATKRAVAITDIPASISVIGDQVIKDFGFNNMMDISSQVPGLIIKRAPTGTPDISMRGIGSGSLSAMAEQDIGLFVDGIWTGRANQFPMTLFDLERVEVVKGTQAALYGRNTLVGAVNVVSKRPGSEFGGSVSAGYEIENEGYSFDGAVDIPISDNFAIRLAASVKHEGAYLENEILGREDGEWDRNGFRLTGVYNTEGDTEIVFKIQTGDRDRDGNHLVNYAIPLGSSASDAPACCKYTVEGQQLTDAAAQATWLFGFPTIGLDDLNVEQENVEGMLEINTPVGDGTMTFLTGYSTMDWYSAIDGMFHNDRLVSRLLAQTEEEYEQVTQEVRFTSPGGEKFDYILGLYYLDQTNDRVGARLWDGGRANQMANTKSFETFEQELDSISVYGSGTYSFSDVLRLTAGFRYTDEEKTVDVAMNGRDEPALTPAFRTEKVKTDGLDGSLTIEWDATPSTLIWAGFGDGSKSPAVITNRANTNSEFLARETLFLDEQTIETFEIGIKQQFSSATVNLTLYDMDINDFQNASIIDGVTSVSSFDAESSGAELDGLIHMGENWTFDAAVAYNDATRLDLPSGADDRLLRAPEWSYKLGMGYFSESLVPGLSTRFALAYNYDDEYLLNPSFPTHGSVINVNASLTFQHLGTGVRFSVIADNLTDEEIPAIGYSLADSVVYGVGRPRTIEFQVGYNF